MYIYEQTYTLFYKYMLHACYIVFSYQEEKVLLIFANARNA